MPRCQPRIARLVILLFALSAFPFSQPASSAHAAGLSPGGLVAYLDRANNLWVSQDNGDGATQISTGGGFDDVVWSNDGTRLAMTSPANGGSVVIASPEPAFGVRSLHTGRDPRWAADSSRVAFVDGGTVHIFDRDGTYQRSTGVGAGAIDWSPSGHRIGFTVVTADPYMTGCPKLNLGWIDADTGSSQIVARSFGKFAWAGDGSRLLYVSTDDGTVRSFDTRSGASQRLSSRLANPCGGPFFTTADGRQ
ncbi:PD40 domain-containing protein, partial [Nitrolancea hollandica]|uniref:TolB family protein n=1 Tax=Nitrolancea hollandica TaxID=1206749 RepID=UPI0012674F38